MLLADNVPEAARTCYLALKATIKEHVNNELDDKGYEHKFASYWLKTIFFYEVEKKKAEYWEKPNVETEFFDIILQAVIKTVKKGMRMFHNPVKEIDKIDSNTYGNQCMETEIDNVERQEEENNIVCPHFWIKNVDLMIDTHETDFIFWDEKLNEIKDDTKKFVTSEWLEWNR